MCGFRDAATRVWVFCFENPAQIIIRKAKQTGPYARAALRIQLKFQPVEHQHNLHRWAGLGLTPKQTYAHAVSPVILYWVDTCPVCFSFLPNSGRQTIMRIIKKTILGGYRPVCFSFLANSGCQKMLRTIKPNFSVSFYEHFGKTI
jgi:hypothetical protein